MKISGIAKYFRPTYLKQLTYRREVETAFHTKRERKLPFGAEDAVKYGALEKFEQLGKDLTASVKAYYDVRLREKETLLAMARAYLDDQFRLFGFQDIRLNGHIQWNRDYLTGHEYPVVMAWKIKPHSVTMKSDANSSIMIGRLYQLPALGAAWALTGEASYAAKLQEIASAFVKENPVGVGIQWYKPSDAAFRLIHLIYGFSLIGGFLTAGTESPNRIIRTVLEHCDFLENNRDLSLIRDHHTFVISAALLFGGAMFSESGYGQRLIAGAKHDIEQESRLQICDDGVIDLQSVPAQLLCAQSVCLVQWIAKRENMAFTNVFDNKTKAMFHYLKTVFGACGQLPNLGDSIPGYIFEHAASKESIAREVIAFNNDLNVIPSSENNDCAGLMSALHFNPARLNGESISAGNPMRSTFFANGGQFLFCSDGMRVFMKTAGHGKHGVGAPGHCDTFSFELFYHSVPMIIDPGTFAYYQDPPMRNMLRSVMFHNTPWIDHTNLIEFSGSSAVTADISKPQILRWMSDNAEDRIELQHYAYLRLSDPVVVKREFRFDKYRNQFFVKDAFLGGAEHVIGSSLHLPSAARIEKINDSEFELTVAGERLTISFQAAGDYELTIRDSWHSPEYFQLYPAKKLQFRTRAALPYFYSFEIKAL